MSQHRSRIDILGLCSLALAILLQGACAGVRSVSSLPATHVVQPGETLTWIAQGYGVGVDRLARANHLDPADRIAAGTRLVIPDGGRIVHRVGPGETLDRIAARYRVSPRAIARENRLRNPGPLQVGRTLVLPVDARLPAPPAPAPPPAEESAIARGRALIGRAEQHYFAARFESAKEDARRAESLLAGQPGGTALRARALFVLASAQAGLGEEQEAVRTFAAVRATDPRFEPPSGWLSPRLEELYRGAPDAAR